MVPRWICVSWEACWFLVILFPNGGLTAALARTGLAGIDSHFDPSSPSSKQTRPDVQRQQALFRGPAVETRTHASGRCSCSNRESERKKDPLAGVTVLLGCLIL
jgi:hypothetical protein